MSLSDVKPFLSRTEMMFNGIVALNWTKVAANADMVRNRTWEKLSVQQ